MSEMLDKYANVFVNKNVSIKMSPKSQVPNPKLDLFLDLELGTWNFFSYTFPLLNLRKFYLEK
jgi:hypothetical protein